MIGSEILTNLGPIGIFALLVVALIIQQRFHTENGAKLDDILEQLRVQNSRIGKVEAWAIGHDKQDDEREERHQTLHSTLQEAMTKNHETIHMIRNELVSASLRAVVGKNE